MSADVVVDTFIKHPVIYWTIEGFHARSRYVNISGFCAHCVFVLYACRSIMQI